MSRTEKALELAGALAEQAAAVVRTPPPGAELALVLVAALVGTVVLLRARRRSALAAPPPRSARARALAARGMSPLEIAKSTGLSRDAVALLLHAAEPERRILPETAGIAAPRRPAGRVPLARMSA